MGRLLATLLLIVPDAPAAAQRLAYADVVSEPADAPPRLDYADPPAADEEEGPVRAFYGDRLEWRPQRGADAYHWDFSGEMGGRRHRLWLAVTGDGLIGGRLEYVEAHALYSYAASDSLMFQAGLRRDFVRPRRTYAELAVQGSPAEHFYAGLTAFLSTQGDLSGRLWSYYDLHLTDDLILQPTGEIEVAANDVPELGVGAGPVYLETGLRLRYRIDERFSPYLGINRLQLLGRTARLAREGGDGTGTTHFVVGIRSYFE